jgi:hypothetical protein
MYQLLSILDVISETNGFLLNVKPPLTWIFWLVIKQFSSAKNKVVRAISSLIPSRPKTYSFTNALSNQGKLALSAVIDVSVNPGEIELARMLLLPNSLAIHSTT